jgi:DNA-binding NarL/FixJ family response regulator
VVAIRTALIGMSPIFRDIVRRSTAKHTTLEIVGELKMCDSLEDQLRFIGPELVLISLNPGESDEIGQRLIRVIPMARIIVFSSDKRDAYIHELRPYRVALLNISPEQISTAIEGRARLS